MSFRLRAVDPVADAVRLGHADMRAFRFGTSTGWDGYFRDNDLLRHPDGVLVVESGASLAGQSANLRFDLALGGRDVAAWGVAGVGVAPEFRKQGVTDKLMRETLRRARRAGVAYAFLNPVSQALYRRFGYETVEWRDSVRATPGQLPRHASARQVRSLHPLADGAAIEATYEKWRKGRNGPFRRTRYWWDERVYKSAIEWAGVDGDRGLAGYLAWDVPREPGYPHQTLAVKELVALTPEAHRALLGFLAQLAEQYPRVELVLPRGHGTALLVEHEHVPGQFAAHAVTGSPGVMGRLVDVEAVFASHPRRVHGSLGLDLSDPVFPEQNRSFDLRGAKLVPGSSSRARLELDVGRLAQIVLAAVPASQLLEQGLIAGDRGAAERLDAGFAGGPGIFFGHANYF